MVKKAKPKPKPKAKPKIQFADDVPPWLQVMRAITGLTEYHNGSNPKIEAMAAYIGRKFPEQADYASLYTDDDIAWCGVTTAFCLAVAGIRAPFGPTDTDRWMWALSFREDRRFGRVLGRPVPGCIIVMEREGGGHVTMFEAMDGADYACRGGNQSDAVNVQTYDADICTCIWPRAGGEPPMIPVEDRPMLEIGDSGPDVVDLQSMLPNFTGDIDGDFGSITETNVTRYQISRGLEVDGICGEETWTALYENKQPLPPPEPPPSALTEQQQADIKQIAKASPIAHYDWTERGVAPIGYIQGMCLSFAQTYKKLKAGHPAAVEMAKARTQSDKDVCNEYMQEFTRLGMSNEREGIDVLRHIYAFMLGSGMCESSGRHCCGRDQSVPPGYYGPEDTTTEAGAFQTSYDASGASDPYFDGLMAEYAAGLSPGYVEAWSEDVSCDSDDWKCWGSGRGAEFQKLCKTMPAFSAETHALTLRNLCNHYGPVNRGEVELRRESDEMFKRVQDYMDQQDGLA